MLVSYNHRGTFNIIFQSDLLIIAYELDLFTTSFLSLYVVIYVTFGYNYFARVRKLVYIRTHNSELKIVEHTLNRHLDVCDLSN